MVRGGPLPVATVVALVLLSGCLNSSPAGTQADSASDLAETGFTIGMDVRGQAPRYVVWDVAGPASLHLQRIDVFASRPGEPTPGSPQMSVLSPDRSGSVALPLGPGDWTVRVVATDAQGRQATSPTTAVRVATAGQRGLAIVDAGPDRTVGDPDADGAAQVALSGTIEPHAGQAVRSVAWSQDGQLVATTLAASVRRPVGVHTFALNVTYVDGDFVGNARDTVTVAVRANQPVVASAGTMASHVWDADGSGGEPVRLAAQVQDPDGQVASAVWREGGVTVLPQREGNVTAGIGTHAYAFEARDDGGSVATLAHTVTVHANRPPVADAGPDRLVRDADGDGAEDVVLDAGASRDPDGLPLSYRWRKAGETQELGQAAALAVRLALGSHRFELAVEDAARAVTTAQVSIEVRAPAPVLQAAFSHSCDGLTCTFDAAASTGEGPLGFAWTFGDGRTAQGVRATHSFEPGDYTVRLQVLDANGAVAGVQRDVSVRAPLVLSVSSPAFAPGGEIPELYGCRAAGLDGFLFQNTGLYPLADGTAAGSPSLPLRLTAPPGTARLAVTLVDAHPNANFAHWALWDIPVPASGIVDVPAGTVPSGSIEGTEDVSGNVGHFPVCGYPTTGLHPFVLTVYALDRPLGLPSSTTRAGLVQAIQTSPGFLGSATYTGTYQNHLCDPNRAGLLPASTLGSPYEQAGTTFGWATRMTADCAYVP